LYANGQNADADKVLTNVRTMIDENNAYYLNANLKAYICRLRLSSGDRDAAAEWLRDHEGSLYDNLSFYKVYIHCTTARAHIAAGNYPNAVLILQKLLRLNERYKRTLDVIETHILLSIAYKHKDRGGQTSLDHLNRAASAAFTHRFTQPFANEGAELLTILHRLHKRSVQQKDGGGPEGYNAFLKTLYVSAVTGSRVAKTPSGSRTPHNLPFTDKQKTVMRLLRDGCGRNKIAETMGLKPYTVKSHIELIYKKLDVSNGIDAILRINELGVLDK
jgi:LuxR family maltose regulon positive regulatory protein